MILIDGEELKVEHFPDGTQRLKLDPFDGSVIDWIYESDAGWQYEFDHSNDWRTPIEMGQL